MPGPRRYHKKKPARRQALAPIAEESAAATREEFPALTSREERLARRLAKQKDFISNPGSSATARTFKCALSNTKAALAQFEADLATLRRIQSGRATTPAGQPAATTRSPTPATATPTPLIPIPIPIPQPSVVQQIERGWIPYYGGPPSGVRLQYIDDAGRPVAQVIPHVYFSYPAPPPCEHDAENEGGDGHYYYPYFALPPAQGR